MTHTPMMNICFSAREVSIRRELGGALDRLRLLRLCAASGGATWSSGPVATQPSIGFYCLLFLNVYFYYINPMDSCAVPGICKYGNSSSHGDTCRRAIGFFLSAL